MEGHGAPRPYEGGVQDRTWLSQFIWSPAAPSVAAFSPPAARLPTLAVRRHSPEFHSGAEAYAPLDAKPCQAYTANELARHRTRGWRLGAGPASSQAPSFKPQDPQGAAQEAEGYFLNAIAIARQQQAKSLE